ncbi:hypothetical protein ABHI18_006150 [Aspergillus niger]
MYLHILQDTHSRRRSSMILGIPTTLSFPDTSGYLTPYTGDRHNLLPPSPFELPDSTKERLRKISRLDGCLALSTMAPLRHATDSLDE